MTIIHRILYRRWKRSESTVPTLTPYRSQARRNRTVLVGANLGVTGAAASEHASPPERDHVSWGDAVEIGKGEVRTYVTPAPDIGVSTLGLYFIAGAWEGLPSPSLENQPHTHLAFNFPIEAGAIPFVWVGVD